MKVKILIPFTFEVNHTAVKYEPGDISEMPDEAVDAFVRCNYVELIKDKPAVKVVTKPKSKPKAAVK